MYCSMYTYINLWKKENEIEQAKPGICVCEDMPEINPSHGYFLQKIFFMNVTIQSLGTH